MESRDGGIAWKTIDEKEEQKERRGNMKELRKRGRERMRGKVKRNLERVVEEFRRTGNDGSDATNVVVGKRFSKILNNSL